MKSRDKLKELVLKTFGEDAANDPDTVKLYEECLKLAVNDRLEAVTDDDKITLLKAFIRWNNQHNGIASPVPEGMADNYMNKLK